MNLKHRIVEQSKRALSSPALLKLATDDRVLKAAEGVMDARSRFKDAWRILINGHDLPNVDPALDEIPESGPAPRSNGVNGSNGARAAGPFAGGGSSDMKESLKERNSLASIGGKDVLEKCYKFTAADNARKRGIYPFFKPLDYNDGPEAEIDGRRVVMFGSNNYLGLTTHPRVPGDQPAGGFRREPVSDRPTHRRRSGSCRSVRASLGRRA
jgi:hypothetical protein